MTLIAALALLALDDWPQWLGPDRDGATKERVAAWTEAPPPAWRLAVGEGHSSPVVAGGRCFLHFKTKGKDEETIVALDALTGKELWRDAYERGPFRSPFGLGPRATPVVDGGRVYAFGVTGILTCWEAATGKRLWQIDALADFQAPNLFFGVSCSPVVEGDLILLMVGGKDAGVVALRKESGALAWRALEDKASYSSPVVLGAGPTRQAVFLTQAGLVGLKPADGKVLWKFPLVDKLSESSTTPVLAGEYVLGSSVTYGTSAVKTSPTGAAGAWTNPALTCYISTPAVVGDRVFMVTGSLIPPPSATLRCVDIGTGKILWSKADVGRYHAALMRTGDGKLLMLDDRGGLALLDPDPSGYKELARSKVCGNTWAHPALANGLLYLRDDDRLVCLKLGP
jgi:outer membrane protein assembly factor BamB